jgi:ABC-type branched-subunit amino acid transport system ATPase component
MEYLHHILVITGNQIQNLSKSFNRMRVVGSLFFKIQDGAITASIGPKGVVQ